MTALDSIHFHPGAVMEVRYLFAALLVVIVALNLKATLLVVRDDLSGKKQRLIQTIMVWLLPIIGACIVLGVHRPEEKPSGKYPVEPDNKVDPAHFVDRDS